MTLINTHKNLLVLKHFRNHLHSKTKNFIHERVKEDLLNEAQLGWPYIKSLNQKK